MKKTMSGFTIMELVIVIIVIGILMAITLVTYNGAQDRAKNAQTLSAVDQWLKALEIYRARNGSFPAMNSCLGANYLYTVSGAGASGVGQCRQDDATTGVVDSAAFDALLVKYLSGNPTPAMTTTIVTSPNFWYRGAYYYVTGGNSRIDFTLTAAAGGCPAKIGGDVALSNGGYQGTNRNYMCSYVIGPTTGY
jgi:prepilin-type N-terminal cleavage/methylation domain-containing protein